MSLATRFDRTVTLRLTTPAGEDARGNETKTTTDVDDVPALRQQLDATEDTKDRDQQARTFRYYFPPFFVGVPVGLTGWDQIIDGPDVLEILGSPELITDRGRPRHIEARAYLVKG